MTTEVERVMVDVTQEDINEGTRYNSNRCPVALALKRIYKEPVRAFVEYLYIGKGRYTTPLDASRFIVYFDRHGKAGSQPCRFPFEGPRINHD